jgi:hypothetical protein
LSRQQHPAPAGTSCWSWRAICGMTGCSCAACGQMRVSAETACGIVYKALPRKRRRRGGQEHEVSGLYLSAAEGRISGTAALHESACRINGTKVVSTPISRAPARGNAGSCGTGALAGVCATG